MTRAVYVYEASGHITGFSDTEQPNTKKIEFEDDGTFSETFPLWKIADGTLIKDASDYLAPSPDPTTQDQINASVLAQIAQDKSDQAVFNSQMLLQVATLKGGN